MEWKGVLEEVTCKMGLQQRASVGQQTKRRQKASQVARTRCSKTEGGDYSEDEPCSAGLEHGIHRGSVVKNPPAKQDTQVQSRVRKIP